MSITASAIGGNWSSTTAWVGGVVPGFTDDVILNVTSGSITVDSPSNCQSLNCTGYTNTLTLSDILSIGDPTSAAGNFTLSAGMSLVDSGAQGIWFGATTGTNLITTAGQSIPTYLEFNGVGATWQFQDNFTQSQSNYGIFLNNGTLEFNGKTFNIGNYQQNGGASTFGAATINFIDGSSIGAGQQWELFGGTVSAASTTINMPTGLNNSYQFAGGGNTYGSLNITATSNTFYLGVYIDGGNTFTTVSWDNSSNTAAVFATFSLGGDLTTTNFTIKGYSANIGRTIIYGAPSTITSTTNTFTNADFSAVTGAGAANWNLASITGKSGDWGGNSGITFTSPINCYWVSNTGDWTDTSKWKTTSGGGSAARVPLPQDLAKFDSNSFTTGSQIVTADVNVNYISGMDWTGATHTPEFYTYNNNVGISGSVTFISGMTLNNRVPTTISFNPDGSTPLSFTTAGLTIPWSISFYGPSGTMNQMDDITTTGTYGMSIGANWNSNGHDIDNTNQTIYLNAYSNTTTSTIILNDIICSALNVNGNTPPGPLGVDATINGTCNLNGTGTGPYQINNGGQVVFNGIFNGQVNIQGGTTYFNDGITPNTVFFSSGAFTIGGGFSAAIFGRSSMIVDGSGNLTVTTAPSLWIKNEF